MAFASEQVVENAGWHREPVPRRERATPAARPAYPAATTNAAVARIVEIDIIPRLLLAHRAADAARSARGGQHAAAGARVADLAELVLGADGEAALELVAEMRGRGISVESLYLDLLAPAARRLGELWNEDRCSCADVAIGCVRLHQVLHHLSPAFQARAAAPHGGRVLLLPAAGDLQCSGIHCFGVAIVAEFFRRAGWDAVCAPATSADGLPRLVRAERFDVIGFSVNCAAHLDPLAATIRAVRRASRNPSIAVLVGGPALIDRPELVARLGADATAIDGRQAVLQANSLLALLPRRG